MIREQCKVLVKVLDSHTRSSWFRSLLSAYNLTKGVLPAFASLHPGEDWYLDVVIIIAGPARKAASIPMCLPWVNKYNY